MVHDIAEDFTSCPLVAAQDARSPAAWQAGHLQGSLPPAWRTQKYNRVLLPELHGAAAVQCMAMEQFQADTDVEKLWPGQSTLFRPTGLCSSTVHLPVPPCS